MEGKLSYPLQYNPDLRPCRISGGVADKTDPLVVVRTHASGGHAIFSANFIL